MHEENLMCAVACEDADASYVYNLEHTLQKVAKYLGGGSVNYFTEPKERALNLCTSLKHFS